MWRQITIPQTAACVLGFRSLRRIALILPPAPALGQHWRALQAVVGKGFTVLELQHDRGMQAEWFFDGKGHRSDDISSWDADTCHALRTAFCPALEALRDTLLLTGDVPASQALQDFLRLGPQLRTVITAALQPDVLPDPVHHVLDTPDAAPLPWADPASLCLALSENLQDRILDGLRDGALTWPSPVDGSEMPCTSGFTLDDLNSLFRFRDGARELDVFVLATEHLSRVTGLYVPAHGVVVSRSGDQARMLRQHLGFLGRYLTRHLALYGDSLMVGRARAMERHSFATFLRPGASAHLGHQLWNELTAIEDLVAGLPRDRLPLWLVPGLPGDEIEFYGPIDTLFPEIAGRVRRGFADQAAAIRYAYENRLVLFRAARERIGDGLRRRVITHAAANAPALPDNNHAILIGLRVENRTVTDLNALCALVIEEAMRLHPNCTIVFDGHNARGSTRSDQTISSHRESQAIQSPLAVERDVMDAMRARFDRQPVVLLDTLGEPLATSLAWAQACDGFVALWGAGLAKYRWVANKPGLIVTSRWNLENKGDLHIYSDEAFMDGPTPLVFVPGAIIEDLPAAPMLVPFEHASYANFSFDPDAMRGAIRGFLTALYGSPGALAALAAPLRQRRGSVDLVNHAVRGWAICNIERPVVLDIVVDGAVIGQATCDMPRPDLLAAGFGTAVAGFGFVIPSVLLDGTPRLLTVRFNDGVCLPLLAPNTPDPFAFRLPGP